VPVKVEPPELARLLDFAERPRVQDWSLRAALSRYAQPEPQRASDVIELMRRIEVVIHPQLDDIERYGSDLWRTLQSGDGGDSAPAIVGLLRAMVDLDQLGDVLAGWAADRAGERPDAAVDAVTADVTRQLARLGVPYEQRQRPPRQRG
jgi:hypothetical protein